jgi:hypothetical protein
MRLVIAMLCVLPPIAAAQDEALARLQIEAVKLRTEKVTRDNLDTAMAPFRLAERDWIESKLPKSQKEFLDRAERLEEELERDLKGAGLAPDDAPKKDDDPEGAGFGYASVNVQRFAELPDMAFVTASATIPCGAEGSVYGYKFDDSGWRRVVDAQSSGMGVVKLELSEPDSSGQRLLLVEWYSQQCASFWMEMTYKVFHLDWDNGVAQPALENRIDFWMGDDEWPLFVLSPTTMTLEFSDFSVGDTVHHRTKIQRYEFTPPAQRIDPVALQPQDFAEEWLTRPWTEMESRSAPATKALHESFGGGEVGGEYVEMTQCSPGQPVWLASFNIRFIGDKQLTEPRRVYLQVRDLGEHRYRMESATSRRPASCKAEPGEANVKYPWLSEEEIRKLK